MYMMPKILEDIESEFAKRCYCDFILESDMGTNDLLVSGVVRTNEAQVWFLAEHLVDVPWSRQTDNALN